MCGLMAGLGEQINPQVWVDLLTQPAWYQIRYQIWYQIWYQIRYQIWYQIWYQICYQIWYQIWCPKYGG